MNIKVPLFFLVFLTYLTTISPTISLLDSPELVACAFNLTIAHPPGHALYILLGKLFSFIPFGSLAWRLNLMSAFFTGLCTIIFYEILIKLWAITRRDMRPGSKYLSYYNTIFKIGAFSAGLILAFSRTFWTYAINAETYNINTFLLALITLSLLQNGDRRFPFLGAFVAGILIASHTVNIIYLGGFVFLGMVLILKDFKTALIKELPLLVFFAIWGSMILLYLPVRNITLRGIYFGVVRNWGEFFSLISGKAYLSEFPVFSIPELERLYNINYALLSPRQEFGLFFCLVGVIGLIYLVKRSPALTLSLLILILSNMVFFANSDLGFPDADFFPPQLFSFAYFIFALFIGLGILLVLYKLRHKAKQIPIIILIILSPLYLVYKNYHVNNRGDDYKLYRFGKDMLRPLEPKSILMCNNNDNVIFFFWYFYGIEGKWRDIKPLYFKPIFRNKPGSLFKSPLDDDKAEDLLVRGLSSLKNLDQKGVHKVITSNMGKGPIYINGPPKDIERYSRIKKGMLYKITGIRKIIAHNPRIENIDEIKYGQEIALLGYNMDKALLVPGESLNITYFWRAQRKVARNYEIAVLLTLENGELATRDSGYSLTHPPAYGIYPTNEWRVGEIIQETSEVFIPPDYKPGKYFINVAVGDKKGLLEIRESKVPVEGRFARIGDFRVKAKEKNKAGSSSNVQR